MKRYLRVLDVIENSILVIVMIVMTVVTFVNVITRKFFTSVSLSFTEELTTMLFILLVFVGAAVAARRGGHIGLTVLTDLLPKKIKKIVPVITTVAALLLCGLLVYYGIEMVQHEIQIGMVSSALQWPEWIFGSFVPIGAGLLGLEFINYCILSFLKKPEGEEKSA